jgi:putative Mg2+ transporter-C (MgtC) family protein
MLAAFDAWLFGELTLRVALAALIGGAFGLEREVHGHWAGFRTHMGVAMGAAIFAAAALLLAVESHGDATRAVQGISAGVGFLGAGTILKLSGRLEIKGLTTAASVWLTAALGMVAGLGQYELACAAAMVSFIVLGILRPVEKAVERRARQLRDVSADRGALDERTPPE